MLETKAATIVEFNRVAAGNVVADFRGRHVRGLATRPSETPRQPVGGLRSAQERSFEGWQQERPHRCAQTGGAIAHQPTEAGLPPGEHGMRTLKELGRSYLTLTQDVTRVMNRIKALYRSRAIAWCWCNRLRFPSSRRVVGQDHGTRSADASGTALSATGSAATATSGAARGDLLVESRKHPAVKLLRQILRRSVRIRSALLVALLQTPNRFRTKRQLWAYSGFAVQTHDSGEYRHVRGKLQRNRERMTVRGLNDNHNRELKNLFKSAAVSASTILAPCATFMWLGWRTGCDRRWPASPWRGKLPRSVWPSGEERSRVRRPTIPSTSSLSIS